jgi:hypothetical protein
LPTDSYCPSFSSHSLFGYSPLAAPIAGSSFFQQQHVPDRQILPPHENQQQHQTQELFGQHPLLKGLNPLNNKGEPMDTSEMKTTWSKIVAGEPSKSNSFPQPTTTHHLSTETIEETMSYDVDTAFASPFCSSSSSPPSSKLLLRPTLSNRSGNTTSKYLTDSVSYIASNMEDSFSNSNGAIARPYTVVKISNVNLTNSNTYLCWLMYVFY